MPNTLVLQSLKLGDSIAALKRDLESYLATVGSAGSAAGAPGAPLSKASAALLASSSSSVGSSTPKSATGAATAAGKSKRAHKSSSSSSRHRRKSAAATAAAASPSALKTSSSSPRKTHARRTPSSTSLRASASASASSSSSSSSSASASASASFSSSASASDDDGSYSSEQAAAAASASASSETVRDGAAPQLPPSLASAATVVDKAPFALPSVAARDATRWLCVAAWLDVPSLMSLLGTCKQLYAALTASRGAQQMWHRAAEPYRVLLERFYCFDMVFECMRVDDARLSARRRATLLARLFALDSVEQAFAALNVIDQGGESFVYLATPGPKKTAAVYDSMERHLRHGEPVALVKAMRFASETLQNQRMRLREVAILVQCQHESIIGVGQTRFRADGTLWVELEYMAGGNIADKLIHNEVRLSEAQAAEVASRVVAGLAFLHQKNIYHRDLKSDNLLLSRDGTLKIGDFGYAANVDPTDRSLIGTTYWMPPEVVLKRPYDARVDVWSLGICVIEMIDGEPPFMCDNPVKAMFHICTQDAPTLAAPTTHSRAVNDFVATCMVKDMQARPHSRQLVGHAFLALAGGKASLAPLAALPKPQKFKAGFTPQFFSKK